MKGATQKNEDSTQNSFFFFFKISTLFSTTPSVVSCLVFIRYSQKKKSYEFSNKVIVLIFPVMHF